MDKITWDQIRTLRNESLASYLGTTLEDIQQRLEAIEQRLGVIDDRFPTWTKCEVCGGNYRTFKYDSCPLEQDND
jgi:hypothetical protein